MFSWWLIPLTKYDEVINERRELLKAHNYGAISQEEWQESDQKKGVPLPPPEKPYGKEAELIDLVNPENFSVGKVSLIDALGNRKSRRVFTDEAISMEELSFLLWATQGVRMIDEKRVRTKRVVPSGGGCQPFETYLLVKRVDGIERGIYRYLPIEHKLILVSEDLPNAEELMNKTWFQRFIGKSAVVFAWAAIPYKTEWRYSSRSYKDILIEAGHICQNLYLACEAIGAGTCAIANYNQKGIDELLQIDGENEITVYLSPVGKVSDNE
jgi:SagB-type dehydrogenase family enzyme